MLFPIGDDNSSRRITPVVTYTLIALNVIFFFLELSGGELFIIRWSVVPRRLINDPVGDFITIFTSMFMHAGWMHLLGNMLYLWIFGDNVEERMGRGRFLLFYLACGVAAVVAQVWMSADSVIPILGASGAISGALAAYLIHFPRGQVRVLLGYMIVSLPALMVIGLWFLLQFISGIGSFMRTAETGGVAYAAHIGGFIAGFILTYLLRGKSDQRRRGDAESYKLRTSR